MLAGAPQTTTCRGRSPRARAPGGLLAALLAALWVLTGALGGPPPAAAQEATPEPPVYLVQPGDTLSTIAERLGTTVEALAAANGIVDPGQIAAGQKLLIPSAQAESQPAPGPQVYVVQPGDTLSAIAQRFGTTVQAIAAANNIADTGLIAAGQELIIPGAAPAKEVTPPPPPYHRVHTVRAGETLPMLAFRYGTTVWALRHANDLNLWRLQPVRELSIPWPTAATAATPRFPEILAQPSPVVQGQTLLVEIAGRGDPAGLTAAGRLFDQDLPFAAGDEAAWALVGVDALAEPGDYLLTLALTEADTGDRLTMEQTVPVAAGTFSRYNVVVPADRLGLLDPTLSEAEREKVDQVFAQVTPARLWEGAFGLPLAGQPVVTAQFGQRRSYSGGPVSSYHSGQDLDGETGDPVYAPAAGIVVLAEPLQVRGGAVILDHGLGVFSAFWHLSQIDVAVGQAVAQGDLVGLVGNTGLSTGSHLHWEMQVRGVPVDAFQWTQQAFP